MKQIGRKKWVRGAEKGYIKGISENDKTMILSLKDKLDNNTIKTKRLKLCSKTN